MNERKPMNPIVQIVLVVVGALVVAAIGYFALIRPEGAKLKRIKADEATAQSTLSAYDQKVAAARSAPKIQFADVYRLAKAMPTNPDMPDVLLELSQLARDSGITFDSIQPQPIVAKNTYSVMPITVSFNGTFYDLADLLYRLRSLVNVHAGRLDATGRLFSVDTLSFGEGSRGFPQIQATLVIDAFVYGTSSASAPSATPAPAATTSTSTTPTTTGATTTTPTTSTATPGSSASGAGAP